MKTITIILATFALFLTSNSGLAQTNYVKSEKGANLRSGPGTNHSVITTIPQNGEVKVIKNEGEWTKVEYDGKTGYISSQLLSEEKSKTNGSTGSNTNNNKKSNSNSNSSQNSASGDFGYTTAIGLRGGFTSGITLKHFIKSNAAMEFILGTRWHGLSISGLYELHKGNAFGVPELTWVYGIGARIGFYSGRYYYNYSPGNCQDPNNPKCYGYWENRTLTAIGLVGIGGLEYKFNEIPITVSLDLMPQFYFNHWGGNFIDGSMSVRYILK